MVDILKSLSAKYFTVKLRLGLHNSR